ncbi:MAG TPA: methyltransferase domain-containing protein [Pseudonocardiaceae bacterium]
MSVSAWPEYARLLADQLTADGDLHSAAWREAMLAVPRHVFVPRYYLQDATTCPPAWVLHEPHDAASTARWLELVYSPTTLITAIAQYADRGVQTPVSSSTKPDLMIRMLEALQVEDGMRVLEIGTGSGYNAALLAHRLGDRNVCSVDIDPALIDDAGSRLAGLGRYPTLVAADGADGLAGYAPFDRLVATCSMQRVPPEWIQQLGPDGRVLVHLEGPLGAGNLVALSMEDAGVLQGRFLPWWGCFMRRRSRYGPTTGTPRPVPTTETPTTRHTTVDPSELDGGRPFPFLAQLYLPSGMLRSIRATDALRAISRLAAPDGSWCEIARTPEAAGCYTLREAGPTPLWARVEEAWTEWIELGRPAMHEFGITATPTAHRIWLSDPEKGPHWDLPVPNGSGSQ